MKISTILFTYNRPYHTKETLRYLLNNTIKPEKLYIFQDGKKSENDSNWYELNKFIKNLPDIGVECEIIVSEKNKGLRKSIIEGISYVLENSDAVIVLEDDCISHPLFMEYMNKSLYKYADNENVYSINGYAIPKEINDNGSDAYFSGRIDSWGWGTWKEKWKLMNEDYDVLTRIKKNKEMYRNLKVWGADLENYFVGNIEGRCNSWAAFWGLLVIEKGGLCLNPYKSFISQIGTDGTGTHSGEIDMEENLRDFSDLSDIVLPDEVCVTKDIQQKYEEYYCWTSPEDRRMVYNKILAKWVRLYEKNMKLVDYFLERNIQNIAIWGIGDISEILINELGDKIKVIIQNCPLKKKYMGRDIVTIEEIPSDIELIIVVPVYDIELIDRMVKRVGKFECIGIDTILNCILNSNE